MLNQTTKKTGKAAENIYKAFKALRKKEQAAVFQHMLTDKRLREDLEDLIDLAISLQRMDQPSRPLEDVLEEIDTRRNKT